MSAHQQYCVMDDALPPTDATRLLRRICAVCERAEPSTIHREHSDRPLHYRVIDGDRVARDLPEVGSLAQRFLGPAQRWYGAPLEPLANSAVAVNVNVTPAGGTYRWHYDRNAVTLILYLNAVIGGAIELCPGYRILLPAGRATSRAQRAVDRVLETRHLRRLAGHAVTIEPRPGRMVMMQGRRCLHSVQPVASGSPERFAVVIALDRPGGSAGPGEALDRYLYTAASAAGDPNYQVGPSRSTAG